MSWQEMYNRRIAICRQCDYFNPQFFNCRKCGCFLKWKARAPFFECPIGKWGKE